MTSVVGIDSYITDGNYSPTPISAEGLKDIVDHVMGGLSREAKVQKDFYADRGQTSGTIDEKVTSPEEKKLKKISKELAKASKMHKGQSDRIAKIVKEKLTKSSSVEDHIDDFKDSDAPQFKGKSLKKIKQMALASFLSKQGKKKIAEEFKVGDKVSFKSGGDDMEIIGVRDMFASDLKAYRVKNADGETFEYDENKLKLSK